MSKPLAVELKEIFSTHVAIPDPEIAIPLLTVYTLTPSVLSTVVPLLFLSGEKGSGKSTIMSIIGEFHGQPILAASSSAAALRNHINESRWLDPETLKGERNLCLLFDNVGRETLKDDFLYLLFLNGYSRATDRIILSNGKGSNITFRVFCPKVISSIHPLTSFPEFVELERRILTVKCKNWERFTPEEKTAYPDFSPTTAKGIDSIPFSVLRAKFTKFWSDETNLLRYSAAKRSIRAKARAGKLPATLTSLRWTISIDLIATGVTFEMWTVAEGIEFFNRYWQWYEGKGKPADSPLRALLKMIIADECRFASETNERLGEELYELEIQPNVIAVAVKKAASEGLLDIIPNPVAIADEMRALGWDLRKKGKTLRWQPND